MNVIGFNFTKISAERAPDFKSGTRTNTNIEFLNFEKEEITLLKESEPLKVSFKFSVSYSENEEEAGEERKESKSSKVKEKKEAAEKTEGEISLEGDIILAATAGEVKDILKDWKKKQIPENLKIGLFNLILKKCTLKATQLEEELNLPVHIPIPQLRPQPPQSQEEAKK